MWDDAVITNVGKTLLAQWAAGGTFNIDSAAAGTGTVNASLLMAQTGLVAQKQAMSIVKSEKITGGVRLQLQLTNKGVSAQYTINQIGVWGSLDGGGTTMMAIFQDDDGVVVPAETDTPEYVFTIYAVLQMDNTGTITVTIDSSVNVSQAQFNELEQKVENLDATDISLMVDGVTGKTVAAGIEELADKVSEIEGGVVTSVNGQTGAVTVTPAGIGAATEGALQDVIDGTTIVAKATHATSADNAAYADSASEASQAGYALMAKGDAQGNDISATYAKKSEIPTEVTIDLNGSPTTSPSFYAPTDAGTAGQVLISQGENQAPVWGEAQKKDISNAIVTLGASLTYNGSAQTQTVQSVVLNGDTISPNVDYKIFGNVATNAGNYTLMITGIGSYSGTAYVNWSISPAQGAITVSQSSVDIIGDVGTSVEITVNITKGFGLLIASTEDTDKIGTSIAGNVLTITSKANGNGTVTVSLVGNYTASASVSVNVAIVSTTLDDNSWDIIKSMADRDIGANIWAVGDTKQITINGTVGTKSMSNYSTWVYIIGFNHNASVEGNHLIHFHGFKTAQTGGTDIGLIDRNYNDSSTSGTKYFSMNHSQKTNSGGWKGCDLRYDILGSTDVNNGDPSATCTSSPVANTLMAALESDLRAVMQPVTKYTDNEGGNTSDASDVTATKDYLWLLAEYEVHGERSYANSAEQNYQQQYAYYANGNSKVKYRDTSPSITSIWWCRSRYASNGSNFCCVFDHGTGAFIQANDSYAVAPCFAV